MADLRGLRILLVEDNRDIRALLRRVLSSEGIQEVYEANQGADGLKLLQNYPCDVVIVDLVMAPISGLEFARQIRTGANLITAQVPIIMISGHPAKQQVEAARDAGVTEFLAKPISAEQFFARIYDVLERPRPFVRTENYIGPDRRRQSRADYHGPFRRMTDDGKREQMEIVCKKRD